MTEDGSPVDGAAARMRTKGIGRMTDTLNRHVALVTGAGSGMGRAHAELLAARGAAVIAQDFIADRGETVAEAIRQSGGRAEGMAGDAGDPSDMRPRIEAAISVHGKIDILVNNAGV